MSASQGTMRIGEVHALLRKDVPDIELSKIRYYEDKGLVEPSRSKKGYRLYSERDVQCLREAIRLANEEFVPLRVVRLRLIEQGLLKDSSPASSARQAARVSAPSPVSMPAPEVATPAVVQRPATVLRPVSAQAIGPRDDVDQDQRITTGEFLKLSGLEPSSINQLVSLGLLSPVKAGGETVFTSADLRIANCAAVLIERGADIRLLGSLRRVVEREIGILEDLTQPLLRPSGGVVVDDATATTLAVARELETLRNELVTRALDEYLGR